VYTKHSSLNFSSKADNFSHGQLFAGQFFARTILRPDNSSPGQFFAQFLILIKADNFSTGQSFARTIFRPDNSSLGQFFAWAVL
jgi:hypothetical protein